ncbi:thiamine pyrophosphate-dependent enzyme [Pseudokordiimonas caeni]|uniref:thiamine pyrophosphate-dependent enzyme n=1 Tax=Pseudokordiimonas caeni TaxID=2997908 RepID=UPI002811535B|nr:thiamine pyrophosphate-dependent enzyme [Pseudokordiimonas caeni]
MTPDDQLALYARARFARAFEAAVARARDAGEVPGVVHLNGGQELVELGVFHQLDGARDRVTGSHRSHGLALAAGIAPAIVAAEIMGRTGSLSGGLGGTQHLVPAGGLFMGSNGIVGGQVPLAAGAAFAARSKGNGGIAVAFFGEGAAQQGGVMETMNLAIVLGLPLLFVCVNNGWAQSTGADASAGAPLASRARAFGMHAESVDGGDLGAVDAATRHLVSQIRTNGQPAFLEAHVSRVGGHYHGEDQGYRKDGKLTDPLDRLRATLVEAGVTAANLHRIEEEAEARARAAFEEAALEPMDDPSTLALWARDLGGLT